MTTKNKLSMQQNIIVCSEFLKNYSFENEDEVRTPKKRRYWMDTFYKSRKRYKIIENLLVSNYSYVYLLLYFKNFFLGTMQQICCTI